MRLYRFWAPTTTVVEDWGEPFEIVTYGYSNESLAEALRVADERAGATINWIRTKRRSGQYYGGERPLREEIVDEVVLDDRLVAIISRNSYGSLILNTEDVFFADVDLPRRKWSLFRKKQSFEEVLVDRIRTAVDTNRSLRLRLYRTKAGYRIMVVSDLVRAGTASSADLLRQLGSDKVYVALCKTQDSYRARLTPKWWRIPSRRPPSRFPFSSADQEAAYRAWERDYSDVAARFATCALIAEFGSGHVHHIADVITKLHDRWALNDPHPLA
ncbi:MAG: hypothetical protein OEO77_08190 [Acidimicrobiia bacterium]|nr:hypothetical protein [Acidimicrobiia bacterium]